MNTRAGVRSPELDRIADQILHHLPELRFICAHDRQEIVRDHCATLFDGPLAGEQHLI